MGLILNWPIEFLYIILMVIRDANALISLLILINGSGSKELNKPLLHEFQICNQTSGKYNHKNIYYFASSS